MTAFNTATESPSVSFTDSYGTAVFQPAGSDQYVYGFARNNNNISGQRYFEFHVVNIGGDPGKVYLGFGNDLVTTDGPSTPPAYGQLTGNLWNGPQYNILSGQSLTNSIPSYWSTTTLTTSDVYMFWVDWSANNTSHTLNGSTSFVNDGYIGSISESRLYAMTVLLGKNGVWGGASAKFYRAPFLGKYGWIAPLAVRGATSASAASVSLKVVTTSFAYPIPTGAVAWGDGPQGIPATTTDYPIAWDPTRILGTDFSLSDNNRIALHSSTAILSYHYVLSTALPTVGAGAGRRVVEFLHRASTSYAPAFYGLYDADVAVSPAGTLSFSQGYQFYSPAMFRGAARTSITNSALFVGPSKGGATQYVVDHDNQLMWAISWRDSSTILDGMWAGTAGTALASPYKGTGTDGFTLTDSVGLRWVGMSLNGGSMSYIEINVGQKAFMAYPLMPGVKSYDGTRQATGVGDGWKTGITPSVSYSHSNFGIVSRNAAVTHIYGAGNGKSSGKYFFQVYHGEWFTPTANMTYTTGLRPPSMTSLSNAVHTKNNLVCEFNGERSGAIDTKLCRYSTTSTATLTWPPNFNAYWESVAVDFDNGRIWFGLLNTFTGLNEWVGGGDPAAGTSPAMTFTASTTLVPFTWLSTAGTMLNKTTIFVGEDNNVVDKPTGFSSWNGSGQTTSTTTTPSGGGGGGVLWPYGVQT